MKKIIIIIAVLLMTTKIYADMPRALIDENRPDLGYAWPPG